MLFDLLSLGSHPADSVYAKETIKKIEKQLSFANSVLSWWWERECFRLMNFSTSKVFCNPSPVRMPLSRTSSEMFNVYQWVFQKGVKRCTDYNRTSDDTLFVWDRTLHIVSLREGLVEFKLEKREYKIWDDKEILTWKSKPYITTLKIRKIEYQLYNILPESAIKRVEKKKR
jgi:hypothetical protein